MPQVLSCQNCDKMFSYEKAPGQFPVCPRCGTKNQFKMVFTKETSSKTGIIPKPRKEKNKSDLMLASDSVTRRIKKLSTIGVKQNDDDSVIYRLGKYELVEEIARGGMGIIFKAKQEGLDRYVALKVMKSGESATEEQIERFLREAQAVAKLSHPNIVPIYDVGEEEQFHYFTMELVEGKTLDDITAAGKLRLRDAMRIIGKTALAVHYAHLNSIIHRDIKPSNIMISDDGEPHVMDFGLARDLSDNSRLTQSGTTMGTPNYMPPEQALGKRDQIDARSDVYALGAVLYELLTGEEPFQGENMMAIMKRVVEEEPKAPRAINKTIARDAETICMKCIEKNPERRYQSAEELARDIARYLEGEAIKARPTSVWEKISRRVNKHKAVSITALVGFVLLMGLYAYLNVVENRRQQSSVLYLESLSRLRELGYGQTEEEQKHYKRLLEIKKTYQRPWAEVQAELNGIFELVDKGDITAAEIKKRLLALESERVVVFVLEWLGGKSEKEKKLFLDALVGMNSPLAFYQLKKATRNDNPEFRAYLARVMANKGFPDAVYAVIILLEDEEENVRREAARLIASSDSLIAKKAIVKILDGDDKELKTTVLESVSGPFDENIIDRLKKLAMDEDENVANKAKKLLEENK